jgi:hypothetical protein
MEIIGKGEATKREGRELDGKQRGAGEGARRGAVLA